MEKLKNIVNIIINTTKSAVLWLHNKNKFIVPAAVVILLVIAGGLSYFSFFRGDTGDIQKPAGDGKEGGKINIFAEAEKGELVGTFAVGGVAQMGDLEVTLYNIRKGAFQTLELDQNNNRISKNYVATNLKVFNTSSVTTEILFIGLEDDKGNQYEMDKGASFYLGDIKDFLWGKESFPRTIREGYITFTGVDEKAEKLKLIIFGNVSKKKIIFEFER
ncbi:MAG: hypothetical protein HY813_02695 [Candidatus Portnoybacteria bacterium]|nr:hypothetical protein [Candidatus Portnoybacteria bacterium]